MSLRPTDLGALCEETLDEVYRYALRLCGGDPHRTSDLVQDTYASLIRFTVRNPDERVGLPWLITCCRHRHLDGIRRNRRRERNERRGWRPPVAADVTSGRDLDEIVEALKWVPEPGRTALVLRHVDGLSIADVAASLRRSVPATDSLLRRARSKLHEEYLRMIERMEHR